MEQTQEMRDSFSANEYRILLPGVECRMWYLGERIFYWASGPQGRGIPISPPHSMFFGLDLEVADLREAILGIGVDDLLLPEGSYVDFFQKELLGSLLHEHPTWGCSVCSFSHRAPFIMRCTLSTICFCRLRLAKDPGCLVMASHHPLSLSILPEIRLPPSNLYHLSRHDSG